jgi:hypothetical protein
MLLALTLGTTVGWACGVRTDPRPPEDTAARAPDDFEAAVAPGTVTLQWERPTRTVDGERLYDLAAFSVERRRGDANFATIATIDVTDTDRIRTQRTFRYVDRDPPPGEVEYRVRAVTDDGEHGMPTNAILVTNRATGVEDPYTSPEEVPDE